MNFSESSPAETTVVKGSTGSGAPLNAGLLRSWVAANAEIALYIAYAAAIALMFACYFVNLPAERLQFYRQSLAAWRAWFGF